MPSYQLTRDDIDEFIVLINTSKLVEPHVEQYLNTMIGSAIPNIKDNDILRLELANHVAFVKLHTWILLAKPHWIIE